MENQEKSKDNADPNANDPGTGNSNGFLVSEKTEDVTVDAHQLDQQQTGEGEENHGDDFLGKANKTKE